MSRFKSKPIEIEAVLFDGNNVEELEAFCMVADVNAPSFSHMMSDEERPLDGEIVARVYDKLHNTWVGVKVGQYIIKGTKGEFYPCDPEVFATKYEEIV